MCTCCKEAISRGYVIIRLSPDTARHGQNFTQSLLTGYSMITKCYDAQLGAGNWTRCHLAVTPGLHFPMIVMKILFWTWNGYLLLLPGQKALGKEKDGWALPLLYFFPIPSLYPVFLFLKHLLRNYLSKRKPASLGSLLSLWGTYIWSTKHGPFSNKTYQATEEPTNSSKPKQSSRIKACRGILKAGMWTKVLLNPLIKGVF